MSLRRARVVVTGGSGFLGMHTVKKLVELGAVVTVLDGKEIRENSITRGLLSKVDLFRVDIVDRSSLASHIDEAEYVIHLAAVSHPTSCENNPTAAFAVNVHGTYNILENALARHAKKVVYASSAHVYGINPGRLPTDESCTRSPNGIYAMTKSLGEETCRFFYNDKKVSYLTLRIFNAFGPAQSTDFFIPATIAMAKTGTISLRGRLTSKDFIYVEDVVDAILKACESSYTGEINIGSGVETGLEQIATYVADKMGANIDRIEDETPPTRMISSTEKANEILGWKCRTNLQEGLDRTMGYFKTTGD